MAKEIVALLTELTVGFAREVSAERILDRVRAIRRSDIWPSFDRYLDTAQYLFAELQKAGCEQVEVLRFPTGRITAPGRWAIDEAWIAQEATLNIVEPAVEESELARYTEDPYTLVGFSTPTPDGGVEGDLLVLEDGQHQDFEAKLVLTRGGLRGLPKCLVERGALGIISDCGSEHFPDAVAWQRFNWGGWRKGDTARCFGFSLSRQAGDRLRALLRQHGRVRLRAEVKTRLEPGVVPAATGVVGGSELPDEEILMVAHAFEPGAADNASGCAIGLEAARLLADLSRGSQPFRLRRSIRFLFAYECFGTMDYLRSLARPFKHIVAGLNVHSVAQGEPGAIPLLRNNKTPDAAGAFTDTVMALFMAECLPLLDNRLRGQEDAFLPGGNLTAEPALGIPMATLINGEYPSYHNSRDTIEVLSPDRLHAVAAITCANLAFLSAAGLTEAKWLAREIAERGAEKIASVPAEEDRGKVGYLLQTELRRLRSLMRLVSRREERLALDAFLRVEEGGLQAVAYEEEGRHRETRARDDGDAAALLIPLRTDFEPPMWAPVERFPEADAAALAETGATYQPLLWVDGRRNLGEIARSMHYEGHEIDVPNLRKYFGIMERAGFAALRSPEEALSQSDLERDIVALGIEAGDTVFLHSSLSSIGFVLGGAETVVDAFLAVLGREGTLAAPAIQRSWSSPFHPDRTPASTGAVAEALRSRLGAFRSRHPTNSVAAAGKNAEYLVQGHEDTTPCGRGSPYERLVELDASIVSIGCGVAATTFFHALEDWMDLPYLSERDVPVVTESGRVEMVHVDKAPPGHRDFYMSAPRVERLLKDRGAIREGKIGRATVYVMKARELASILLPVLAQDPTLFLCDQPTCDFCTSARRLLAER